MDWVLTDVEGIVTGVAVLVGYLDEVN